MMAIEQYEAWRPVDGIPDELFVEGIHHDVEGLRFLLRAYDPTTRTLRLRFESVVGYRNINESYRLRTWDGPAGMKGLPCLMTVKSSGWIRWLVEESGGVLLAQNLTHYAIYTPEDCIDVVTEFPPTAEWLNE